jgi:hypothetical protein
MIADVSDSTMMTAKSPPGHPKGWSLRDRHGKKLAA